MPVYLLLAFTLGILYRTGYGISVLKTRLDIIIILFFYKKILALFCRVEYHYVLFLINSLH